MHTCAWLKSKHGEKAIWQIGTCVKIAQVLIIHIVGVKVTLRMIGFLL